jgi:prephenate dehydrogenase
MDPAFALDKAQVTIVGLGLMGGSLALALQGQCRYLTGVVRRRETITAAMNREIVDKATDDLFAAVQHADIVVLATPVCTILQQITQLGPHLPAGALLIDLGSTKSEIVEAMARLPSGVHAIGGHPMCGKEQAGLDVAEADLYHKKTFVLCPPSGAHPDTLTRAQALVQAIGACPLVMDPARHDRLVAAISHLPYLLSAGLVATASEIQQEDPLLSKVASSGFRDTSRLAGSDVRMMCDILLTNGQPILEMITNFQNWLDKLSHAIECKDGKRLENALTTVQGYQKELRNESNH